MDVIESSYQCTAIIITNPNTKSLVTLVLHQVNLLDGRIPGKLVTIVSTASA